MTNSDWGNLELDDGTLGEAFPKINPRAVKYGIAKRDDGTYQPQMGHIEGYDGENFQWLFRNILTYFNTWREARNALINFLKPQNVMYERQLKIRKRIEFSKDKYGDISYKKVKLIKGAEHRTWTKTQESWDELND